ncbi:MAG: hypothetical protein HZA53_09260 [Planctomycetes bacterium]|nr:hypothetical protein [Planctomycetota bacterium]
MSEPEDDLLRPTLAADFDVRTFDRPWDPSGLPIAAFFFGPLGGGILYALNYRRLGQRRHARWCFAGAVVVALLFIAVSAWLIASGVLTTKDRIARYGVQGLSALLGLALTRHQSGRFGAWEALGQPKRKLLGPALAIGIGAGLLYGLLFFAALFLFGYEFGSALP